MKKYKDWLAERKIFTSSIKTYISVANVFELNKPEDVNEGFIVDFLERHRAHHYRSAVKRYVQFLGLDIDFGWVYDRVRAKRSDIKPRDIKFEEVKVLVDNLSYPYNMIVQLQFEFGGRIREVLTIQKENLFLDSIDGQDCIKVVLKTKGGKSRVVFTISKGSTEFLKKFIPDDSKKKDKAYMKGFKGLLFPRKLISKTNIVDNDKDMLEERRIRCEYWIVWHEIKSKAREILGKDISTHWFRHGRILDLYEKGYDPKTIQRWTGHSSLDMLNRYLISAGQDAKKLAGSERSKGGLKW